MIFSKKNSLSLLMSILFLGNVVSVKSEFDIKNFSIEYCHYFKDFLFAHKDIFVVVGLPMLIGATVVFAVYAYEKNKSEKQKACRKFVIKFLEAKKADNVDDATVDEFVEKTMALLDFYCCKRVI